MHLRYVELHDHISEISSLAFSSCTRLEEVRAISVTKIGIGAFYNCHSLSYVSLKAVSEIGMDAFAYVATTSDRVIIDYGLAYEKWLQVSLHGEWMRQSSGRVYLQCGSDIHLLG